MTEDEMIIKEIVSSFTEFAFPDIHHNIKKPIAGFILCSCLIDQLAGFRYNTDKVTSRFQDFVKEYMPPHYIPINLHDTLRNKLVHNYSVGGYYSLTSDPEVYSAEKDIPNTHIILLQNFVLEIEAAFEKIKGQFYSKGQPRTNALLWYRAGNKPLIKKTFNIMVYSKKEADLLISYYTPLIVGKTLEDSLPFVAENIIAETNTNGESYIVKVVAKMLPNYVQPFLEINSAATRLALKSPDDVLKGLH